MKQLFKSLKKTGATLLASVGLAASVHASGTIAINTPQSGYDNFSTNGSAFTSITNVFSPAYTYPPVTQVFLSSGPTNALPLVTSVTTSNLIVTINTATNCAVYWTAFAGYPRLQFGTNAVTGGVLYTNTFTTPYASIPSISVDSSTTNSVGLSSVSTTGFVILSGANQTVYWNALGICATPGASAVTY